MTRTARRLTAWLLLFAMAFASAAPAFASRAWLADLSGICSLETQEARNAGPANQQQDPAALLGRQLHHCPFCAPAAHAALPSAERSLPIAPVQAAVFVLPRPASPARPVHRGSTSRPRGPPQAGVSA